MSRDELATAANEWLHDHGVLDADVDATYIGKLERGVYRWPTKVRREALRAILGAADDLALGMYIVRGTDRAALTPTAPGTSILRSAHGPSWQSARPADGEDCQRPAAAVYSSGLFEFDAADEEEAVAVLSRVHRWGRTVDPQIVAQLSDDVRDVVVRYEELDHHDFVPTLRRQRAWVEALIGECNLPRQRRQLFGVACVASGVLGYVAVGRGRLALARAYCAEAFQIGTLAEDPDLQAWARGLQSFTAYYSQDFPEALDLAMDGLRYAQSGPQSVRLTINGAARAMGKMGDVQAVERLVGQAYDLMSQNDPPPGITSSIGFGCYSHAQVASNAATAFVSLGLPEKVRRYIDMASPEIARHGSAWSRALVAIDLATALAQSEDADLEQATHLVLQALDGTTDRPVISINQRIADFASYAAGRWGQTPQITAVRDALLTTRVSP